MTDYNNKVKELRSTLQNIQRETTLLLRPYDVSRVLHPITEDISDWSVDKYVQTVRERTATPHTRQKRSWIPFLGRIAKTIFGVATDDDVATLHCHIAKFEHLQGTIVSDQTHVLETVHSLYKTQDKRINILHRMLQGFVANVTHLENDLYQKLYTFLGLGVLQHETLLGYQAHLHLEMAGLNRLFEGYLPREFIPPSTMQQVLQNIKDELSSHGSGFQLAYSDVQHYYHIQDIAFCVKHEQLFIMLKIPISRITARMDIYRLIKFYTPYEYLQSAGIHYDIKEQYLAITKDAEYYLELSTEDYLHCKGNELKKCPYSYLIREVSVQPSCNVGLFLNDLNIISKQCNHMLIQHNSNNTLSRVLSLNNGSYLIASPDTDWT
jgi:hypothetical protein